MEATPHAHRIHDEHLQKYAKAQSSFLKKSGVMEWKPEAPLKSLLLRH
jgi:hypothetical protein